MKKPRPGLAVLAALLCLALCVPHAFAAKKGSAASRSDIRVLLRRLNLTDSAWLTLEGRYLARCADGTELLLPSSAGVTVLLRDGRLVLFAGGVSLSAGQKLSLIRVRQGDTVPGIRFNLQEGLYPGDLTLSLRDGRIEPVLTLPLETYLQGVVPYEMSDSFPPEALKAQAVCARTYALSKMNPSERWDVTDTTDDQVFRGLLPENKNSAGAVAGTEGLVLTSGGRLITAWYSASNGGQTELPQHVWGGSGIPACFAVTEDPWDAENPNSLTRTAELKKDGSNLPAAFRRLLRAALQTDGKAAAFRLEEEMPLRAENLRDLRLSEPRYKEPSRLMTRLSLTFDLYAVPREESLLSGDDEEELDLFALMGKETEAVAAVPSPAPAPGEPVPVPAGSFTVTLNLFPDIVGALGLSISGADNEIITVTENADSFTLRSGRFGHGVGLSQRGAEQQAKKGGRGFEEILSFYYPGAKLKRYAGEAAPLPTPDPALAADPGPVPTATPRPTLMPVTGDLPEGAWLASVENIDDDSSLNLRAAPSPGAAILMRLYKHQRLIVLENAETEGWVRVKTDAAEGYVMSSFLKKTR